MVDIRKVEFDRIPRQVPARQPAPSVWPKLWKPLSWGSAGRNGW